MAGAGRGRGGQDGTNRTDGGERRVKNSLMTEMTASNLTTLTYVR